LAVCVFPSTYGFNADPDTTIVTIRQELKFEEDGEPSFKSFQPALVPETVKMFVPLDPTPIKNFPVLAPPPMIIEAYAVPFVERN
jgi:hypothetical protein